MLNIWKQNYRFNDMIFDDISAVTMENAVFWYMVQCVVWWLDVAISEKHAGSSFTSQTIAIIHAETTFYIELEEK
jgi:hypothetical protein